MILYTITYIIDYTLLIYSYIYDCIHITSYISQQVNVSDTVTVVNT